MNVVRCGLLGLVLVGLLGSRQASAELPDSIVVRKEHPRIYLTPERLAELRRQVKEDRQLAEMVRPLREDADRLLAKPVSIYIIPDGKRLLHTSRAVLDRTAILGLVYRLDGKPEHKQRLWQELEAAASFKDWNPSHFLDTGEMAHAVGLGYDWLYDEWTPEQRKFLREAIVRHALNHGVDSYAGSGKYGWFAKAHHNWNQVCNGGLTAAALAVYHEEPLVAGKVITGALKSIPLAMREYNPDGAYKEGAGYWSYGSSYNIFMIAALQSATGSDQGLSKSPGFEQTGFFLPYMTGPTGLVFNFADDSEGTPRTLWAVRWLAHRFNEPALLSYVQQYGRPTAWDVIHYRADMTPPQVLAIPKARHWPTAQVATLRTAWNDPQATFVGLKAGSPRYNHAQADLGSFVLDARGQRWAVDLGRDDYNLPGYFGPGRWNFYRNRAEGHNTLVIGPSNQPDQAVQATCHIVRFGNDQNQFAVTDLTAAYPLAKRVERGFQLGASGDVLIQDEIELRDPAPVYWFMHTRADIQIGAAGNEAKLVQGNETLAVHIVEPAGARLEIMAPEPLPTSPTVKGQHANQGVRKLAIKLDDVTSTRIIVSFTTGEGPAAVVRPLAEWK